MNALCVCHFFIFIEFSVVNVSKLFAVFIIRVPCINERIHRSNWTVPQSHDERHWPSNWATKWLYSEQVTIRDRKRFNAFSWSISGMIVLRVNSTLMNSSSISIGWSFMSCYMNIDICPPSNYECPDGFWSHLTECWMWIHTR